MGFSLIQVLAYSSGIAAFRSSQRDHSSTLIGRLEPNVAEPTAHPAHGNCFIGSGHSVSRGCGHNVAIESVFPCADDTDNSTCIKQIDIDQGGNTGYSRFTSSTEEWNELAKVVVDAEFAGYGASVSVGVDYLQSSKSSESSIGFFCGSSLQVRSREIINPSGLKWTSNAKWLLSWNPEFFAQQFGIDYVYKMDYGGSFLASFTLNSRTKESQSSLDVFAKIAVENPSFDANLGAAFNSAKSEHASNITLYASAKWSGSTGLKQDYSDPGTVGEMFNYWQTSVRENPVPLTLQTRKWSDSDDFVSVLATLPDDKKFEAYKIFQTNGPTQRWRQMLGQESAKLSFVSQTIEREINLVDGSDKIPCLRSLRKKVNRAIIRIQQLDDITAAEEEKDEDSDIIQSSLFLDQYKTC